MLELLTFPSSIATTGLHYFLEPKRWARMTTVLGDRFKAEKDFGAMFCYSLDRSLQNFFDKVTRWPDIARDGNPNYLLKKAETLFEAIEDGRGLNIILPITLLATAAKADPKKRDGGTKEPTETKKAKKTAGPSRRPPRRPNTLTTTLRRTGSYPTGHPMSPFLAPKCPV